jgi:hypothetical protein
VIVMTTADEDKTERHFFNPEEKEKVVRELFRQSIRNWSSYAIDPFRALVFVVGDNELERVFPFEKGSSQTDVVSYKSHTLLAGHHLFLNFMFENDRTHQRTDFNIPICPLGMKTTSLLHNLSKYVLELQRRTKQSGKKHTVLILSSKCSELLQNAASVPRPGIIRLENLRDMIVVQKSLDVFATFCGLSMTIKDLVTEDFLNNVYHEDCQFCPDSRKILRHRITPDDVVESIKRKLFSDAEYEKEMNELKDMRDSYFRRYI